MPFSDGSNKFVRAWTRKSLDEHVRFPKAGESVDAYFQGAASKHPLRDLGWASDGQTVLTEEARESHIHILGAPGEGKSKLLELLIRQDIDQGYGCCLLDPSDNGDTAYKVLKYCIKKGFDKVLLIDPHDVYAFNKVPTINPIHYDAPANVSVGNIMDTLRILWNQKEAADTARINKYVPAVLRALHEAKVTLHESLYFTDRTHPVYRDRRLHILDHLHPLDANRVAIESVFGGSRSLFSIEMESSARRFNPFLDDVMQLIVGSNRSPVNFANMIAEGWVILVNLDPQGIWDRQQQRLLGTLVVNELIHGLYRLLQSGWKGVYYLYVDEVGDYATPKLAEVLDKKRKSGMRFTVAHQRFNQIEDINVRSSIEGSTKIKVLFNTPSRNDRDAMLRMMYGGKIPDRQVSYELGQLRKQYAAIKINKQAPRITRIPDLPDIQVSKTVLEDFKRKLYEREWYSSKKEILNEINARFNTEPRSVRPQQPGDSRGNRKPTRGGKRVARNPAPSDDGANRETGQPAPSGRQDRSVFSEEE